MIIFLSDGRLGNQLFQYAFLNSVARNNELIIAFNMEEFLRGFEISNANLHIVKLNKYTLYVLRRFVKPILLTFLVKLRIISYVAQDSAGNKRLPTYTKRKGILPVTLVETNFFQSESFFEQSKVDFALRSQYLDEAKKFLSVLPEYHTKVFVHVRRGDYLIEHFNGIVDISLPKSFFYGAIEELSREIERPFFIFLSDDPDYVEQNFQEIENKIVSRNSMLTDFGIMTLCPYGVISNSSFSWWGGYFMNQRKKVIVPKYWYGWKIKADSHIGIYPSWGTLVQPE